MRSCGLDPGVAPPPPAREARERRPLAVGQHQGEAPPALPPRVEVGEERGRRAVQPVHGQARRLAAGVQQRPSQLRPGQAELAHLARPRAPDADRRPLQHGPPSGEHPRGRQDRKAGPHRLRPGVRAWEGGARELRPADHRAGGGQRGRDCQVARGAWLSDNVHDAGTRRPHREDEVRRRIGAEALQHLRALQAAGGRRPGALPRRRRRRGPGPRRAPDQHPARHQLHSGHRHRARPDNGLVGHREAGADRARPPSALCPAGPRGEGRGRLRASAEQEHRGAELHGVLGARPGAALAG
mmetsp:Transcript_19483/g.51570  ORF Transcript_19483/g.51570 Transcript_19483/m.51570 type:complete len:298 (-) Transcript_19483:245-1138(-)